MTENPSAPGVDTPIVPTSQAWGDALHQAYGSWDRFSRPNGFNASLRLNATGGLQMVEASCDPCSARRTPTHVRRDDREFFAMTFTSEGQEKIALEDRRLILAPGDVLITNSTIPAEYSVVQHMRKTSVLLPLPRVRSWLPNRWNRICGRLAGNSEATRILRAYVDLVAPSFLSGTLKNGEALTESIMGLLVAILDGNEGPSSLRTSCLEGAKRFIEANLSDPRLSITAICASQRISARYLHALFELEGTTVQRYIYQQRLLRCARELENPLMASRPITDIAFFWGFQNVSHFSRRFKDMFGVSPTAYRRIAAERNVK